jgi:hypothetical protein
MEARGPGGMMHCLRPARHFQSIAFRPWIGSLSMDAMVLDVGFELTTYRLQGGCSPTELIQHYMLIKNSC